MIIKPSTALRNDYGSISDLAHTEDAPIYITKNGEGDLVIMSIDAYERREEVLKLRAKIEAATNLGAAGAVVRPAGLFHRGIPEASGGHLWTGSVSWIF